MPDENKPCTCDWLQKAQAIGIVIAAIGASVSGVVGLINHNGQQEFKQEVKASQEAAVQKADEVKAKIDTSSAKQESSLKSLEDSQGPQLWLTWKRIEEDANYAEQNGLTADAKAFKAKALDAKAKFDAHMARQKK